MPQRWRDSVSALAPGSWRMVTVGGRFPDIGDTGSTREATMPAITMMIEMTEAKIGRLMKNAPWLFLTLCRAGLAPAVGPWILPAHWDGPSSGYRR